ncbi:MAG: biopolymer transporter ExbD [Polyangiales bacterium]|jgi:biopolymer transport protein ExbD
MAMNVGAPSGKKGKAHPEMNVTPLVDVVLVLLIIFMVIMPLMPAHFWVHVPDKPDPNEEVTPPDPDQQQPIVISVNPQGELQINREIVPDAEFAPKLKRVLIARGERKVFFDAADKAPYSRAVRALDLARIGGAAHIAVLTEGVYDQ